MREIVLHAAAEIAAAADQGSTADELVAQVRDFHARWMQMAAPSEEAGVSGAMRQLALVLGDEAERRLDSPTASTLLKAEAAAQELEG